jgi:hypothetical protein
VLKYGDCGRRRAPWQMCLSVLLIGLILYNPFLALINCSDGLTYQALARNRATVGASEMLHFASMPGENAQLEATVERICVELVVEKKEFPSHAFEVESLPQRPELTTSVYFRPPPTR